MNAFFNGIRNLSFRRGPRRLVGGIAGGAAAAMGINPWLARLILLFSFLLPFIGLPLYLVLWALTPWQDGSIPLERLLSND